MAIVGLIVIGLCKGGLRKLGQGPQKWASTSSLKLPPKLPKVLESLRIKYLIYTI